MEGVKDKGRPKFLSLRGKKEKITEYIDLFYSLHHLYKYIEPQKTKQKKKRKTSDEKKKQRNTESHNSSKANRKQERREQ